jgi:hypothetical protein
VEVAADKIPAVDHVLDVIGTFVRPVAGGLAAAAVFQSADPAVATLLGMIVGAPTAFGFHAIKAGARATSSLATMGVGNPVLSVIEDLLSAVLTILSLLAPVLVPLMLIVLAILLWKLYKAIRQQLPTRRTA